jgi:hypothetical protein
MLDNYAGGEANKPKFIYEDIKSYLNRKYTKQVESSSFRDDRKVYNCYCLSRHLP